MLTGFLAFLGAIPGIGAIVNGLTTAFFNAKVQIFAARTGVTRDVALATIQASAQDYHTRSDMLSTFAGSKVLVWIIVGFAVPIIAYDAKCIVWDTMLDWGSTPPIHGQVAEHMNLIINWLFGSSTTLVAGSMALKAVDKLKG